MERTARKYSSTNYFLLEHTTRKEYRQYSSTNYFSLLVFVGPSRDSLNRGRTATNHNYMDIHATTDCK